jgi:TorA maturation chaperone TorD
MDHLSTLLEQLYWSDEAAPTQHEDFVLELLGSWVPKMLRRLEVAQPNAFYRNAGQILAAFLGLDVSIEDPPIFHVTESTNGLGNRTQENS